MAATDCGAVNDPPETRYARLGKAGIAYQVVGEGPLDLLWCSQIADCMDLRWDWPAYAQRLVRLASFCRLIMFDARGFGASDSRWLDSGLSAWEEWTDDANAVLDACGSERAAILGIADAGPTAMLFAATQPERTSALILINTAARFLPDIDYPWGFPQEDHDTAVAFLEEHWGTTEIARFNPEAGSDPAFARWVAKSGRMSCGPGEAGRYLRWRQAADVRTVLPSIQAPTLVLHGQDVAFMTVDQGRYLAEHIPGAQFVVLPGADMTYFLAEHGEDFFDQVEEFLTGNVPSASSSRALAAVLFTDIVGSTEKAVTLGDHQWREVLESHDAVTRSLVGQHGGRLVKMTGDGALATFDGPGRAIRCAFALRDALEPLGITIRAGLHAGEVEFRQDDISGVGVHIAARVLDRADGGELLASSAIPLLVAGSGIEFQDRGEHELKGVTGTWKLYAVQG